jgi:hypothetical protein
MKVENMTSNNGNKIANQFIINSDNAIFFQSYDSIICKIEDNKTYLDSYYYNYSKTTSKYRNIFLNLSSKEIEKKIADNEFILTNLNNTLTLHILDCLDNRYYKTKGV